MEVVIRDIWVECCGHLSAFDIILKLINQSIKWMDFMPLYEESIPGFKERIIFPMWNTQKILLPLLE